MTLDRSACECLAALHAGPDAFIIPNPWDAGSARLLQGLGFRAVATTSAGFAFTVADTDGAPPLDAKLAHCTALAAAVDVPVSVDFEDGFGATPEDVASSVRRLADTGVAGCSIEDWSRDRGVLFDEGEAVERLQAAAEAVRSLGVPFQLVARAEQLLRGTPDLDAAIRRLQALEAAGADMLYAPGVRSLDDLATLTAALGRPVNVLGVFIPGASLADFAAAGARRVSLGAALTWAALKPLVDASREMLDHGTFTWTADLVSGTDVSTLLRA